MRASLMSAAEERLKPKVTEEFMRTKAEVQSLHSTNRELLDGQERINSILSSISNKIEEVESHEVDLKAKEAEIAVAMRHLTLLETQRPGPDSRRPRRAHGAEALHGRRGRRARRGGRQALASPGAKRRQLHRRGSRGG